MCDCGEDLESVKHYVLDCMIFSNTKILLLQELRNIKVPPSLRNLLGGGAFDLAIQNFLVDILVEYIKGTHKINKLVTRK